MSRCKIIFCLVLGVLGSWAFAYEYKGYFLDPNVSLGHNVAQGTNVMVGADIGYGYDENLSFGLGAHFSAGENPAYDRQIGAGPFVAYVLPITPFLVGQAREDLNYVDLHNVAVEETLTGDRMTYIKSYGVIAATSFGLHLAILPNFGISGGYRIVKSMTNSNVASGRSGPFFGFALGI